MSHPTRELCCLGIGQQTIEALGKIGLHTLEDVQGYNALDLAAELKIDVEEAYRVMQEVETAADPSQETRTVLDMAIDPSQGFVLTFSRAVDGMLGGGVKRGEVTEVCGLPGTGKTQLAMQCALDCQIPTTMGGQGGEAVYIDSEGSFTYERAAQMAEAVALHLKKAAQARSGGAATDAIVHALAVTQDRLLAGIHVFRVHNYREQLAVQQALSEFLREHPKVCLVVVDSISFHFRHSLIDNGLRTRLLSKMAQHWNKLAQEHSIAVLMVNQMTTRVDRQSEGGSRLVPALGESWAHVATSKMMLYWRGAQRCAELLKSPRLQCQTVAFRVSKLGVRDIPAGRRKEIEAKGPSKRQRR
ncbi:unnamed protein product [Chrysoparadoxa australica]